MLFVARLGFAADDSASAKSTPAAEAPAKAPAAKSKPARKYGATIGGKPIGNEHIEFDTTDDEDPSDPGHLQLGNPSIAPGADADSSKP